MKTIGRTATRSLRLGSPATGSGDHSRKNIASTCTAWQIEAASSIIQRTLHQIITGNLFRLYFNPPRYKHICFEPGGVISEGRNDNESSWRIVDNQLELVQADGGIHSRFDYDYSLGRFTANGTSGKGLAGQYIVPSM